MTEVRISDATEITIYDQYVNIFRESRRGERSVNVPISVINWSILNKDVIDSMKLGFGKSANVHTTTSNWRVIKSLFRNKLYAGFALFSDSGVRCGYVFISLLRFMI